MCTFQLWWVNPRCVCYSSGGDVYVPALVGYPRCVCYSSGGDVYVPALVGYPR